MPLAAIRCIDYAGRQPAVGVGIISAARVPIMIDAIVGVAAPDDHFTPCPYCRRKLSPRRGLHRGRSRPAICARIVFPASIGIESWIEIKRNNPPPDDHLAASPDCYMITSRSWCLASRCPAIGSRIVSPAVIQVARVLSTPNDHFTAGPHDGVTDSGRGCIGCAGG